MNKNKQGIDLKNLDANALLGNLLEQKLVIAKLVVVVLACAVIVVLVNNFFQQKNAALAQMADLRRKLEVIGTYRTSKQNFEDFTKAVPKPIEENIFLDTISDFASQNGIEITTFSPVTTESFPYYDVWKVQVSVGAKSFKSFVEFMRALEASSNALRVDKYSMTPTAVQDNVSGVLNISTVKTKITP